VGEIVPRAFAALRPGGRLVAAAVLLETKNQLNDLMTENLHEIVEIGVCRAVSIGPGRMMRPDNPVTLYVFEKKRSEA
jgi:precorrin-6Y C5,15-methyltransferase (decarboxylating)